MARARKLLLVLGLTVFGVWGCDKGSSTTADGRLKQLETQVTRLDDDLKASNAARETLKAKLLQLENGLKAAEARMAAAEREKAELAARLTERTAQLETFRTDLRTLLGRTDAALLGGADGLTVRPVSLQK